MQAFAFARLAGPIGKDLKTRCRFGSVGEANMPVLTFCSTTPPPFNQRHSTNPLDTVHMDGSRIAIHRYGVE
jgi:hypothetical protein